MTAPADDCGVAAGCGACPLGRAGVCGDPVPEPLAAGDYPRGWAMPVGRGDNGHGVSLTVENDPELGGEQLAVAKEVFAEAADAYVDEALARIDRELAGSDMSTAPAEAVATVRGCYLCQMGDPHGVHQTAAQWFGLPGPDPDAPDVDPAEPRPEGVGCCGGGCRG